MIAVILTNLTKIALSSWEACSLSISQTAETAVRDIVSTLCWKPIEALAKGDTFDSFSGKEKLPLPMKSKCGMKVN